MIRIINYNNIIDIDIEIQEPIKKNNRTSYLDAIIGNRSIEFQLLSILYFSCRITKMRLI